MDNPEILFYIVFGLIYFLTRKKKKKKIIPPRPKNVSSPSQQNKEEAPPSSFEELLKELTGQGRRRAEEKPKEPEPREDFAIEEEETPEIYPKEPEPREVFAIEEEEAPETHSKEVDWTKDHMKETLTSSFDDEETSSKRFEAYKIKEEQSVAANIKKLLSDPDDIKNAVILSEVLKRRY